jgi:hypothetical protein
MRIALVKSAALGHILERHHLFVRLGQTSGGLQRWILRLRLCAAYEQANSDA